MDNLSEKLVGHLESFLEKTRAEGARKLQARALGEVEVKPLESIDLDENILSRLEQISKQERGSTFFERKPAK